MQTLSALLAICVGNSPVPGEFPAQRPVTQSFHVFFDLRLNKPLSKQSWGWWFEMPSCSLWRHGNEKALSSKVLWLSEILHGLCCPFNSLGLTQNGSHFAHNILKCIFLFENCCIWIEMSQKFVHTHLIDNMPALFQVMACRWSGNKALSETMMAQFTHAYIASPGLSELTHLSLVLHIWGSESGQHWLR